MNAIRLVPRIRRVARAVAGLAAPPAITGPAAFAGLQHPDPPWWVTHPLWRLRSCRVHPALAGGMPGWQITLIAVGAAGLAATALLLGRALAARRHPPASSHAG
jgi:hypothetical protein